MFRYAVRRVLWSIPALLATSFVLFLVTTLAPEPPAPSAAEGPDAAAAFALARRMRFLDLPSFVNPSPWDVRRRAREALSQVASGGSTARRGAAELVRLGGAALPYVLPDLESLGPDGRRRVAVALAPLAARMGISVEGDLTEPDAAVLFWTRFWDDRALDFTRPAVDRAVARLVEHGSDTRENDLVSYDTFALQALVRAMRPQADRVTLERLTRLSRHAAQRGPVVEPGAADADVTRAVADWREWWFVFRTDFVEIGGAGRAIAVITDTRYGRWLRRIASGELGVSARDGQPVLEKLAARGPLTLLVCTLAMLVSWSLAVPIGVLSAWQRGRSFDLVAAVGLFVLYSTPTFALAELLREAAEWRALGEARVALAVAALAASSMATLARWQRAALLDVLREDYVRSARAKGVPEWRVLVVHALRNALMPVVTAAGTHLPVLLGGAMVVEEVFGLPGVGTETLRAIESHDSAWLMAVLLSSAVLTTVGLILSDVAYGSLDPRVREVLLQEPGSRT